MTEASGVAPPSKRVWVVLATTIAAWMPTMDQTIANTALPSIAHDLDVSAAASIWIVNAYQVALAIGIVPLAAAGDILGYRRVFQWSMLTFVFASVCCALAHTLVTLCAARFLQGLAGSALTMSSAPIVRLAFPPNMLGRAISYTALGVALGAAAGPPVSGVILSLASWHWLFALNVPVCLGAFFLAAYGVPRLPGSGRRFDWQSAGLSVATFGLGALGFDGLGHRAFALAFAELLAAAWFGRMFVRRQHALPVPMFPVDLFADLRLSLAAFAAYASFIGQAIAYVALPFAFQTVMGRPPLEVEQVDRPGCSRRGHPHRSPGRLADRCSSAGSDGPGDLRRRVADAGLLAGGVGYAGHRVAHGDLRPRLRSLQSPNNRSIQGSAPRELLQRRGPSDSVGRADLQVRRPAR